MTDAGPDSTPLRLLKLFDVRRLEAAWWHEGDLADLLTHELSADLVAELHDNLPEAPALLLYTRRRAGPPPPTVRQLLLMPKPHRDYLELLRRMAAHVRSSRHSLPDAAATALYYAAVAASIASDGAPAPSASVEQVRPGLQWLSDARFVESGVRDLARRALVRIT
jgi:hypothetical protein